MLKKVFFSRYLYLSRIYCKRFLKRTKPYIIGIHGSVGKTSCRLIVTQILQQQLPALTIYTSPKNFNGEFGLPLSLFQIESYTPTIFGYLKNLVIMRYRSYWMPKSCDIIVLEYGIDRPGEMDYLLSIAKPDIGIHTLLDKVHSEQFGDPKALAQEEIKMLKGTKSVVFINAEDHYAQQIKKMIYVDTFVYDTQHRHEYSNLSFSQTEHILTTATIQTTTLLHLKGKKIHLTTNLIGKENVGYCTVGLTIVDILAQRFHQSPKKSDTIYLHLQLLTGRQDIYHIDNNIYIDSTYNASPASMRKLINDTVLLQRTLLPQHKIILMLGDMRELGADLTPQEHRLLAGVVSQSADRCYLVGPYMRDYLKPELTKVGYTGEIIDTLSAQYAGKHLKDHLQHSNQSYIVLFKGSQNTIYLEEALKHVLPKEYHHKLVRQDEVFMKAKKTFFTSV